MLHMRFALCRHLVGQLGFAFLLRSYGLAWMVVTVRFAIRKARRRRLLTTDACRIRVGRAMCSKFPGFFSCAGDGADPGNLEDGL